MPVSGAKPAGAENEEVAAHAVREMFDSIAPRYDLLNHVLSANIDRLWWRKAARSFRDVLERPEAAVLDICCGTGDLTLALLKFRTADAHPILAADFSRGMLSRGAAKFGNRRNVKLPKPFAVAIEADALCLPLRDRSLDLVITSFGFRNLANYEAGLQEFYRVLKPGGKLGILEFAEPSGMLGSAYAFYFRRILPSIGRLIGGKDGPYSYLPRSVGQFPTPQQLLAMMHSAGYIATSWKPYTFGIAGLYTAERPF